MYMGPEQAGLGGVDVDTRSDVYLSLISLCCTSTAADPPSPAVKCYRCQWSRGWHPADRRTCECRLGFGL